MSMHTPHKPKPDNWMHEPLAVVGLACRLPGSDNLQEFWELLRSGSHGIGRFPESFVDRDLYLTNQKGVRGKSYSDVGGLISDRPIDWSLMPIDRSQADQWDPCHLILCEVTAAACRQAGYDPRQLPLRRAGVYIGHSGGSTRGGELAYQTLLADYVDLLEDLPQWHKLSAADRDRAHHELLQRMRADRPSRYADGGPNVDAGCAASLISRAFGLSGPHMSIDAACASSLVALALGATALHAGDIDMAIVGGASYNKFDSLILFSHAQSCSASASRPFDAAADGLISSEGYVVFVLKTLAKAEADGDRIAAVIRGIGISSDGRGRSLWAPRKEGQATAIERAYAPEVSADSVQMVEAHATSTQVGDATEMEALASFFKQRLSPGKRLPVGSVKSNIGHTLETAGLAGVLKAILSIQHGVIPPSINVQQLSSSIPWNDIPLYVPHSPQPWPTLPAGQPRRAAVNAFGIGGLNVHVIVDQHLSALQSPDARIDIRARPTQSRLKATSCRQPIAIIGRGVVLPGALDVEALANRLSQQANALSSPPPQRWRKLHRSASRSDRLDVLGGFITDYQYDWRKHKVPPKQIAQANPLQFMLLEAAEQALREAGCLDKEWNRQRAAVVVGSVFGGDFGHALYAGLRLPEFQRTLADVLKRLGGAPEFVADVLTHYEQHFLKTFPALLDETGSFTSSTLASRLSKTFDLMGGAMAIDAGEASALAALDAGIGLLRSGVVDHVLCATAQSSLDRASLERLSLNGRLVERTTFESTPADQQRELMRSIPAEGVALVLLKRLDDALADGDKVLATIQDIGAVRSGGQIADAQAMTQATSNWHASARTAIRVPAALPISQAMQRFGNLQGAQGLVDLIEVSLGDSTNLLSVVAQQASSGLCYCAAVQAGQPVVDSLPSEPVAQPATNLSSLRFSAADRQQLAARLNAIADQSWMQVLAGTQSQFTARDAWRAALVVGPEDYQAKARLLASQMGNVQATVPLAEQGLLWSEPSMRGGRVAWLFPGQGSQYPHMLRAWIERESTARQALDECNAVLAELGQPTFEELAWSEQSQLGEDVWHTQASMLISDYVIMRWLQSQGLRPDVVAGHSFGEFAAMLAAGCWNLRTALIATWHRCRSIVENVTTACGMLSIQAPAQVVQQLIDASHIPVSISHRNAPEQTVVGGKQAAVAQFAQIIDGEGLVSRLLAVPTAFHTPALTAAQAPFAKALQAIAVQSPQIPLLSSVHAQFVTDPAHIRSNLATQLVKPLDYVTLVERLIEDGVQVAVEVGPQQVLTRLTRQIAGQRLTVLSTDHVKRGTAYQILLAQAGLEVMTNSTQQISRSDALVADKLAPDKLAPMRASAFSGRSPIHFDATAVRRERMRQAALQNQKPSSIAGPVTPTAVMQFDASQLRRDRNRQSSAAPAHYGSQSKAAHSEDAVSAEPRIAQPLIPSPSALPAIFPAPVPMPAVTNVPPNTSSGDHVKVIETFLIDFVVEQTGYPAEIIELDWDIEADLGIDSIKKAQLFGELREFFDLESLTSFSLDSFKTLRDIVNLLVTLPGKGDWLTRTTLDGSITNEAAPHETASREIVPQAFGNLPLGMPLVMPSPPEPASHHPEPVDLVAQDSTTKDSSQLDSSIGPSMNNPANELNPAATVMSSQHMQQFLIDFVVEQTGYPPEIVDMDSDLEADLGIDSIKKAQLFGELREMFTFPAAATGENNRLALSDFRTLRSVLELLQAAQSEPISGASKDTPISSSTGTAEQALEPMAANKRSAALADVAKPVEELSHTQSSTEPTAGSHEFRSLVPLPLPATPFSLLGELPVAYFSSIDDVRAALLVPGHNYVQALFANLQAMAGRAQHGATETTPHYNGQRERVSQSVSQLANTVGAAEISLLALDACALQHGSWHPAPSDSRASDSSSSLRTIADYKVPDWLSSGNGIPLAAHVHTHHDAIAVEWLTPGCVTGMAHLAGSHLVVGGMQGHQATLHDVLQLQQWLKQQATVECSLGVFEKAVRQLRLSGDWWAMCVDLSSAQRLLVECHAGVIVIEKGSLPPATNPVGSARLCLDVSTGEVVVHSHLKPHPFVMDEARLPVSTPRSEASITDNDAGIQAGIQADVQADIDTSIRPIFSPTDMPTVLPNVEPVSDGSASVSYPAGHVEPGLASTHDVHELTKRFILRMAPAPQRVASGRRPTWSGAALIVGDNPVAIQLESRLRSAKVPVTRWSGSEDPQALALRFEELIKTQNVRHLFLTTPCDTAAVSTLDRGSWQTRRNVGLMSLFWLCQRWHQHILASGWADDASLVAVTSLGGDFGIGGRVPSIEGGALSGLLKAILIESWVQGLRTFPIKVIDTCQQDSPAQIANNIWQELAVPSFDIEVAYCQGERHVIRAIAKALPAVSSQPETSPAPSVASMRAISRGGTWVCTGGARGITAYVAQQLALKYGLKLHLIGTQPLPVIKDSWRDMDDARLREVKAQVMTEARAAGGNPVTTWQDVEKAIEIDRNLRRFAQLGIEAHYHSCDVADRDQVASTLQRVRAISGPIHGVLHGAGIGKDARFDRKQAEKVNQCIGAKIDGAWSLIEATWQDPLEAFVGFGSISGRFGANGHTDYSLSNDMLCKQMDWLRSVRPEVHAVGFHWHAWGDIGMATKPEVKLALEMVNMQFMPAVEGVQHLLRELASDSRESEVLITDDRYYRLFYAPEALVDNAGRSLAHLPPATPLVHTEIDQRGLRVQSHTVSLEPAKDPFLTDHKLDDRPLLPIVIGTEIMLEAARAHLGRTQPLKLHSVRAVQGLRFYSDQPSSVRVATSTRDDGAVFCQVMSDFHARDGRLVQRDRLNMSAVVDVQDRPISPLTQVSLPIGTTWHRPAYPAPGSKFYVGPPLQRLRGFTIQGDGLVGRITAPALIELAGGSRDVRGWQLPSSALDACLFASGILAWQAVAPGSALPTGFGEIEIGRLPGAGEACEVHVRLREAIPGVGSAPTQAAFDFTLYGVDREVLVNVRDYRVAWLIDSHSASPASKVSAQR